MTALATTAAAITATPSALAAFLCGVALLHLVLRRTVERRADGPMDLGAA